MRDKKMIAVAAKAVSICIGLWAGQAALAQTTQEASPDVPQEAPRVSSCIPAGEMLERFLSHDTADLPRYKEGISARVQRQHPKTRMYLHAKYIEASEGSFGICQYTTHIGVVASYGMSGVYADASDGTCGPGYCVQGAYWREEWVESFEEDDKAVREYIYTCMKDRDGTAYPSGACGFSFPEQ